MPILQTQLPRKHSSETSSDSEDSEDISENVSEVEEEEEVSEEEEEEEEEDVIEAYNGWNMHVAVVAWSMWVCLEICMFLIRVYIPSTMTWIEFVLLSMSSSVLDAWVFTLFACLLSLGVLWKGYSFEESSHTMVREQRRETMFLQLTLLPIWLRCIGYYLIVVSPTITFDRIVHLMVETLVSDITNKDSIQKHHEFGEALLVMGHIFISIVTTIIFFVGATRLPSEALNGRNVDHQKHLMRDIAWSVILGLVLIPCIVFLTEKELAPSQYYWLCCGSIVRWAVLLFRHDWKNWRPVLLICLLPWPWFLWDILIVGIQRPRTFQCNVLWKNRMWVRCCSHRGKKQRTKRSLTPSNISESIALSDAPTMSTARSRGCATRCHDDRRSGKRHSGRKRENV